MKGRKKTAIVAVVAILGFWLLSKSINALAKDSGAISYKTHCATCHGNNGEGFEKLLPPLASDWLENNMNSVPCIITNGLKDTIEVNGVVYAEEMLPLKDLTEIEILNITNYISKKFTKEKKFYNQKEIKQLMEQCH
ncbi:MAG: cytochrome c [Chitinophagales bacterium]|nr:cytochrome c [Chitinophagales bacterium]